MSFDLEEWSATVDPLGDEDDLDRGAAANFVDPISPTDNSAAFDEYEDDPDFFDGRSFMPKPNDWKEIPFTKIPTVSWDMARSNFWEHAQKEINFFINKIKSMRDPTTKDKMDNVVQVLVGPRSDLFHAFQKICPVASYYEFAQWIGAFYFSCHMGKNYNKLCQTRRVDSKDFADPEDYDIIWNNIEDYAKGHAYKKRAWKLIQEALNTTLKENFLPSPKELKQQICVDDDKAL